MARGVETRARILSVAREAVLWKGFDATSIDEIVAGAELTRSGFFYHFPDKNALAVALIDQHADEEREMLDGIFARAAELSDDPLQRVLIAMKLLAETVENVERDYPGCIVATAAFQDRLFSSDVREANRRAVAAWRDRFIAVFEELAESYPPRTSVEMADLADTVNTVLEGGIVMAKALGERRVLATQVLVLRNLLRLAFEPPRA
ncbi:TetR/AcrR family transcriptional regulator [Pseudoroseicyclus tamaricis]|uniref:TetR/AcrR family transcriptional regulator n=1 Tax=Pseudoroseicyclus tamaricis TaxID=2705421 RepID=A0A6B2JHK6_9RHOB|nr:TetR/AcrR family transcriptional regulator [Pseudoroseicyclus tamaricis]NDV00781.1 TetR/AcrR family transcriptional regulator [Pseudoroseicyclus tamaricis]